MISKRTKIIVLGANAKVVTAMGDAVIFMTGIALGSLVTMFILLVAMMTDEIRRNEWK